MTRSTPILLAGAVAAALAPARPGAVEWRAHAGVDYERLESEARGAPATSVPRLDVNLALDTGGTVPGIVSWGAGVGYRRIAVSIDGTKDVRDQLNYRLRSSFFGKGLVAAEAQAARTDESISAESVSATSARSSVYGASLRLQARERPYFDGSYLFTGTEIENPALGPSERTLHSISAGTGFGSPSYTYRASYRLNVSDGTFALDDFEDHRVEVLADARFAPGATLTVSDGYYLRTPRADAPGLNAREETNTFLANLRAEASRRSIHSVAYSYAQALRSVPAGEEVERASHRLGYGLERVLPNPEYRLRGDLRASYAEDRLAGEATTTSGQTLGLTGFWRRTRAVAATEVHLRSSVGLLDPAVGDARVGWGAAIGGFLNRAVGALSTSVSYDLSYARDLDAEAGSSLQQAATGAAWGRLGRGSLRGSLQLASSRRDDPLFGATASRSVTLSSSYGWAHHSVQLQGSLQDGGDGLAGGFRDGLFIAPAYESHTRSAMLGASTSPWRVLTLRARLRLAQIDLPDRPASDEKEAYGAIEYGYGALRLVVEDRYVIVGSAAGELRVNQIFLRASRTFGSRL